jgi:putative ABC transport system permease protein
MLHKFRSIFRFFLKGQQRETELDTEVRYHFERQIEENIRRGMKPEEARRAARRSIGGFEQVKEECREARLGRAVESTLQDIRYGVRVLFKNPGFSCTAIVTLALGIGVNTAIFSVVYGALLRPLPYRQGEQLIVLHQVAKRAHLEDIPFSVKEILDYRNRSQTLQDVVEHHTMYFLLYGKDWAERVQTAVVSANFFDVLGVRPLLGRTFVPRDDTPKSDPVLILSYKYWKNRYGADADIVGKIFQMNHRPHTVIGVLPPIPQYPAESDIYVPTAQCPTRSSATFIADRTQRMMIAFGRVKAGVPLQQVQAEISTIAGQLEKSYPEVYPKPYGYGVAAAPLRDDLTRRARNTFLVLLGAAGFVLLIACANVGNLLLARLLRLERELAVRAALGASKLRLTRQLLTESILLSLAGAALGLAAAPSAVALLVKFAERFTTRAGEVRLDTPVLLFTLLISLLTGLLFGLAPAFSSTRQASDALKQGGNRLTMSRSRQRFRAALVVAQVAVSLMLLIGAGLMIRSFMKLQQVNPGFNPDHLLTMRVTLNYSSYKDNELTVLSHNILRRVRDIGAVQSAALASNFPFNPGRIAQGPLNTKFEIEGRPVSKGEVAPLVDIITVSPQYFQTLRQPVLKGRDFTEQDDAKAPGVGIINQTMAHHRWPTEDAVGKRVTFFNHLGDRKWTTIVGVVGDTTEYGLNHPIEDELYVPADQDGFSGDLTVRTAVDPMSLVPLIRSTIHTLDPQVAVDRINTIDSFQRDSVASPRLTAILLGLFAALALVICASGIAAVMALSVSQRTHELGIRIALGAKRQSILRMVAGQGLMLTGAGAVIGVAGALVLTRLLSSLLYGTSPTDIYTFLAVSCLFMAVAVIACLVPARQVTSIDPVIALRQE